MATVNSVYRVRCKSCRTSTSCQLACLVKSPSPGVSCRALQVQSIALLQSIAQHCTALHSIAQHCTALQSIAEHCRALQSIVEPSPFMDPMGNFKRPRSMRRVLRAVSTLCAVWVALVIPLATLAKARRSRSALGPTRFWRFARPSLLILHDTAPNVPRSPQFQAPEAFTSPATWRTLPLAYP